MRFRVCAVAALVCLLLASLPVPGLCVLLHQWSFRYGGASDDNLVTITTDASGNVILAARTVGTVDFGGGPLTTAGSYDIVMAKFDASGNHLWSKRFGGTGTDMPDALAVNAAGDIFLASASTGNIDFGGGNLPPAGDWDICVVRMDPSGAHVWSKRFGNASYQEARAIVVDASSNVFLTGYLQGSADFGGGAITSAGGHDLFLASLDGTGSHRWSARFGDSGAQWGEALALDASGNLFVLGSFTSTINLGGSNLVPAQNGWSDLCLARFTNLGAHSWSKRFGGLDQDNAQSLDCNGNDIVVTSYFSSPVSMGGATLSHAGNGDIALAKYDNAGNHLWSKRFGDADYQNFSKVRFDVLGNVLLTGPFLGTVNFGGSNLTTAGGYDAFLAKFDAAGTHLSSYRFGDTVSQQPQSIAVIGLDRPVIAGQFAGTVNFGGGNLVSAGSNDIFLARFADEATIPVLFSRFDARAISGAIEITWTLQHDENLSGYSLYRRGASGPTIEVAGGEVAGDGGSFRDETVTPGASYSYELVVRSTDGGEFRSPSATVTAHALALDLSCYPNPFNPRTTVSYTVPSRARVTVAVYDARGARVAVLFDGERNAGSYAIDWDGRTASGAVASSGVFFARIEHNGSTRSKKMVLLK